MRVGIGYDIHRLGDNRKLFLGGVEIPCSQGLLAHPDGDVVLHAICDALLGACGSGDIGMHFPDSDPALKDISSLEILKRTYNITQKKADVNIINIDVVIVCDEPKLMMYTQEMKRNISGVLGLKPNDVNVKSKTTEGTATDVILSYAVVLVDIKSLLKNSKKEAAIS